MTLNGLKVDGTVYKVRIPYESIRRMATIYEGQNSGVAISGKVIRDVVGTGYSYDISIEQNPLHPEDYDELYEVLSAPVESHEIEMPYGQESITYNAGVKSLRDTYGGNNGFQHWRNLSVTFSYIELQRS